LIEYQTAFFNIDAGAFFARIMKPANRKDNTIGTSFPFNEKMDKQVPEPDIEKIR
jgi:hypothetical protein